MDRFSTRLAASLIEDRHREAAAMRRITDPPPTESDATSRRRADGDRGDERALGTLLRPLRFRIGAR